MEKLITEKFRTEPCKCCGQDRQLVNGAWLREKRLHAGYKLREVARRLKITPSYICDVELDRRLCTDAIRAFYEKMFTLAGTAIASDGETV